MDNIEKIIQVIAQDAATEVKKIEENSRRNITDIENLYHKEADLDREEIMGRADREVREIHQRSLSQIRMEERSGRLAAKQRVMEEVFHRAEKRLGELPENRKKELYEKLIKKYSGTHEVTIQLNQKDGRAFEGKLQVPGITIASYEANGTFQGGLIIKEGDRETSCTFEALIKEARQVRETEIAELLFT